MNPNSAQYEVRIYRPGLLDAPSTGDVSPCDDQTSCIADITLEIMTRAEVLGIDPEQFDLAYIPPLAYFGFRTADGQWRPARKPWRGSGPLRPRLLQALMLNPGIYLSAEDIAKETGMRSFTQKGVLPRHVHRLRKMLLESGDSPHFILTSECDQFGVAWNPELSWIWVIRI